MSSMTVVFNTNFSHVTNKCTGLSKMTLKSISPFRSEIDRFPDIIGLFIFPYGKMVNVKLSK